MTRMVKHSERSQPSKMRTVGPLKLVLMLACAAFAVLPAAAQRERPALNITGYVIDAELDTTTHHLAATTVVSFTAPANLDVVNFGFHPALKVTKITDESGKLLEGERTADGLRPRHRLGALRRRPNLALDLRLRRHHHRQLKTAPSKD
jgi:hypothetical protein